MVGNAPIDDAASRLCASSQSSLMAEMIAVLESHDTDMSAAAKPSLIRASAPATESGKVSGMEQYSVPQCALCQSWDWSHHRGLEMHTNSMATVVREGTGAVTADQAA